MESVSRKMTEQAKGASPEECEVEVHAKAQQALFAPYPASMPVDLPEPQRSVWKQILERLKEG